LLTDSTGPVALPATLRLTPRLRQAYRYGKRNEGRPALRSSDDPIKARASYMIRTRFHHRAGYPTEWWEERKTSEAGFQQTAADILANQVSRPLQVVGFDLQSGTCWDASRDIAQAVLDAADAALACDALDFVEQHIGIRAAREAAE
jgi:hypothetical protein